MQCISFFHLRNSKSIRVEKQGFSSNTLYFVCYNQVRASPCLHERAARRLLRGHSPRRVLCAATSGTLAPRRNTVALSLPSPRIWSKCALVATHFIFPYPWGIASRKRHTVPFSLAHPTYASTPSERDRQFLPKIRAPRFSHQSSGFVSAGNSR